MKNTPHQSAVLSLPTPTAISDHYADYLLYFLENRCDMSALKQHFSLTSRQVLEFLTSREVKDMLAALQESVRSALAVSALKARDFAVSTLKTVCLDLVRQTSVPSTGPINELAHAKAVNYLRLASGQLGRLAAATIAPPKQTHQHPLPSQLEHLVPTVQSDEIPDAISPGNAQHSQIVNDFDRSNPQYVGTASTQSTKT